MVSSLYKLGTAVAAGSLLVAAAAPLTLAATTITVSGNGAFSNNTVTLNKTSNTNVTQDNTANISNTVNSSANTGDNSAAFNTGGSTNITTGNAWTNTTVNNTVNSNVAHVDPCGECTGNTTLKVVGNGALSNNTIDADLTTNTNLDQDNDANIKNDVKSSANTGYNSSAFNTGGSEKIDTGNAGTSTKVYNTANSNWASIGGNGGHGGGLLLRIAENGAFSNNTIDADLTSNTTLDQDNDAHIKNDIDADANSGYNTIFASTGGVGHGDPSITTGDAMTSVKVNNDVNHNFAAISACCFNDVKVDVEGNGASLYGSASNTVDLTLANDLYASQDNDFDCSGKRRRGLWSADWEGEHGHGGNCADVNASADTGDNSDSFGTNGDSVIDTGDASSSTKVENTGNTNTLTSESVELPSPLPTPPSDGSSSWTSWMMFWNWFMNNGM